jgi:hypothetical protein
MNGSFSGLNVATVAFTGMVNKAGLEANAKPCVLSDRFCATSGSIGYSQWTRPSIATLIKIDYRVLTDELWQAWQLSHLQV